MIMASAIVFMLMTSTVHVSTVHVHHWMYHVCNSITTRYRIA
jgi:hypothetical protein